MSLTVALNTARTSLQTSAKQLAVSGANVASANDPSRTRKIAYQTTDALGAVRISSVGRAADMPLFYRLLGARAIGSASQAVLEGLTRLHDTIGDPKDGSSPAGKIATLATALQTAANSPGDRNVAQGVVTAARIAAETLAHATDLVQQVRADADNSIGDSVTKLNRLLADLAESNTVVVRQTLAGEDATDAMDRRDALLTEMSAEIGIRVVSRPNNDIAVYADGGATLFDKTARPVTFETANLAPGTLGNAVYIDGVPVTGASATMPIHSGNLAGLTQLRDETAPTYQAQLDEMARGLVTALAESDQSGGGGPDLAGLLTWPGGPALPASGVVSPGLAAALFVNPAVDLAVGGDLTRLRDGGMNGAAYVYNPTGAASFADRLVNMIDALNSPQAFDPATGLSTGMSVIEFSATSVGWLEDQRQVTTSAVDFQNAWVAEATDVLSNASGVNIDDEYALQLRLEQAYQASSKLIAVVQAMMDALLQAVG